MLTLTNRIDMRPGAVPLVIHLGQYDSDFSLVFELYSSAGNFTVESGTTAMIRGTKTDGHAYDADATIDISAKTVTVAGSEQMTAAKGRNVYELVLKKGEKVLSTANFILDVERAAMDADTIASESVLKELNAIIDSAATSTQAATNAASSADRAENAAESVSSASAQIATNTADISDLKADFEQLEPGLSAEAKAALLACFAKVAWIDEHGQDYVDVLEAALYPGFPKITAVLNLRGHTVFTSDTLDSLKDYLEVIYYATHESDGIVLTDSQYTLIGQLNGGSNVIHVSYGNVTTTFNVDAVAMVLPTGYTRKDYLNVKYDNNPNTLTRGVPATGLLIANVGLNLNALTYEVTFYPQSGFRDCSAKGGIALFGGRPAAGSETSLAVYINNNAAAVGAHVHGTDTGLPEALENTMVYNQINNLSLRNGSQSPSILKNNDKEYEIVWTNQNSINAPIHYFINKVTSSTNTQYIAKWNQVGILKITNISGEVVSYLIPVVRNSDNVIGIYDGISDTFIKPSTASYSTIGNSNCVYEVGMW